METLILFASLLPSAPVPIGPAPRVAFSPLPRKEAEDYATKVLELCAIVREEHILEPEVSRLLSLGISGLYAHLREPIPGDVSQRLGKLKDLGAEARKHLLADMRQGLGKRGDLSDGKDILWTMREMLTRFDRWSGFEFGDNVCIFRPQYFGVGLVLRKNAAADLLEVVTPLAGGPAHKSGVMAGDVISAITWPTRPNGDPLPEPHSGMGARSVSPGVPDPSGRKKRDARSRHDPASRRSHSARNRNGKSGANRETVHGWRRKRDGTWDHWLDAQQKIAYFRISQFTRTTAEETRSVLQQLQNQGVKGLVLDLRCNPGGVFTSVKDMAGLFVKEGVVASLRAAGGKSEVIAVEPAKQRFEQPLVVLINAATASGGEMLAACLQDHKRATLLGERSCGKGGVQDIVRAMGGELMLTSAVFLRPAGKVWQSWQPGEGGEMPDPGFVVRLTRREREELWEHLRNSESLPPPVSDFKDVQLDKALAHLRR